MTYLNMKNGNNGMMIVFDDKYVEFWLDYNTETFKGAFHDNNGIDLALLAGMTAEELSEEQADEILINVANAMKDDIASRYSVEINGWILCRDGGDPYEDEPDCYY